MQVKMSTDQGVKETIKAIGNAIKEAGAVPSGHLYSILSQFGCTIQQYDNLIAAFKKAGKVKEAHNLLYWVD